MAAGQIQAARLRAEERRVKVSEMYFRLGMRQQEIAEQLGTSQASIARDIKILLARWKEASLSDIREFRGKELADLAEMERDCALEFQKTKDPRFMSERRQIKKRRSEMLGLDAPVSISGPGGGPIQVQAVPLNPAELTDEELAVLETIMERTHETDPPQLLP
jgi:transposase